MFSAGGISDGERERERQEEKEEGGMCVWVCRQQFKNK